MIPNPWLIVGALVALIAVGFGGTQIGMKLERSAWLKKDNKELVAANAEIQKLNDAARETEREHAAELATIGSDYVKDLEQLEARRRSDVDAARSGALKLRIPGACKVDPSGGGQTAPAASGSEDPTTGELPGPLAAALFALADDADSVATQLSACQRVIQSDRASSKEEG